MRFMQCSSKQAIRIRRTAGAGSSSCRRQKIGGPAEAIQAADSDRAGRLHGGIAGDDGWAPHALATRHGAIGLDQALAKANVVSSMRLL